MNVNNVKYMLAAAGFSGILPLQNTLAVPPREKQKPNIIFILTDDLGFGDLGILYQNQRAKANDPASPWEFTPNLDLLGREGVQMPDQYCAAPVCAPSRASILSGKSQGHANVRDNQFDKALEDNYTLGSVMRAAGYSTVAIGKWGLQGKDDQEPNWTAHPLNRGFDYFFGYMRHKDGHEHYPKEGLYDGPKEVWENRNELASKLDKCYTADLWTAVAKKWITDHERGKDAKKPFMMYLAYDTPHAVLELPTQAYPSGGGLKGGVQWIGQPGHMINTASGKIDSWFYPAYANATYDDDNNPATPEVPWPDVYKRYATATHRIDDAVGDIMQLLKDLDIDDNTMIVFTSDNGPSIESYLPGEPVEPTFFRSFGPFDGIKRDCWEGGVRMPTLARWPGHIPAGRVIKTPSISYDWMATFADMAGLPAPAESDGVSLLPSLTATGTQIPSQIYVEYDQVNKTPTFKDFAPNHRGRLRNQMQLVRLGNFVGVRYDIKSADDNFEIYNVVKDPQETDNLAGNAEAKELQQQMKDIALQSRRPNITAPRPYDDALVPGVSVGNTKPGVGCNFYSGEFPWVPQVETLTPVKSEVSMGIQTALAEMGTNSTAYFNGYLNVPADGEYTFTLKAAGKAVFRLHNATVIDADFEYFNKTPISGTVKLKAGLHPFRLYYVKDKNIKKPLLNIEWNGPGFADQPLPDSVFSYN